MVIVKPHTFLQHDVAVQLHILANTSNNPLIHVAEAVVDANSPPLLPSYNFEPAAAPLPAQQTGLQILFLQAAIWIVLWVMLFYICAYTWPYFKVVPSSKDHENDKFWCGREVAGCIHAAFVGGICLVTMMIVLGLPSELQFASTNNLAFCAVDPLAPPVMQHYAYVGEAVGIAGLAFITFTFCDVFLCAIHGILSLDQLFHHIAFICAGAIIRGNCMLPLNASILLAMEISTPFLNWRNLFRHREGYSKSTLAATICFGVSFTITRVCFNLYGAMIFWVYRQDTMPPTVPAWVAWSLIIAVSAGLLIQFFWFSYMVPVFFADDRAQHKR